MRTVKHDTQARTLEIELDGQSVLVKGLDDARFQRRSGGEGEDLALWVSATEADVLVKMINYILAKVKITDASRAALESILPRASAIAEQPAAPTSTALPRDEKSGATSSAAAD